MRRFQAVDSGANNCIFIQTTVSIVSDFVICSQIILKVPLRNPRNSQFVVYFTLNWNKKGVTFILTTCDILEVPNTSSCVLWICVKFYELYGKQVGLSCRASGLLVMRGKLVPVKNVDFSTGDQTTILVCHCAWWQIFVSYLDHICALITLFYIKIWLIHYIC